MNISNGFKVTRGINDERIKKMDYLDWRKWNEMKTGGLIKRVGNESSWKTSGLNEALIK